jgi:hypothetical protein
MENRKEVEAVLVELRRQAEQARREAGKLIPLAQQVREEAKQQLAAKKNKTKK